MALPPSGPISLSQVNTELGQPATQTIGLGDPAVRALAEVPSGPISMSNLYGKSSIVTIPVNYTSNTANVNINISQLGGYVPGKTKVIIDIAQDVYIYSDAVGAPAMNVGGATAGDEIIINNHGFISGRGGNGGAGAPAPPAQPGSPGGAGSLALNMTSPITINNYNTIAGGGGGGGGAQSTVTPGFVYKINSGGGGGGGGRSLGAGGIGGQGGGDPDPRPRDPPGAPGTLQAPGNGGAGSGGTGGNGGAWATAGAPSSAPGGGPGGAIAKNGNVLTLVIQGIILGTVT